MKKCPKCGTILDDSKKKCYMCGTQLSGGASNFGDTFDAQIGASVSESSNNAFADDGFLFNNNSEVESDSPDNAFFGMGMDSLNSMEYDERSDLKKGFDSVFKTSDSFKSKDDEQKKAEEAEIKRKQQEEAERLKREEKERLAKEKQLKKERDKERQAHEKAERQRAKAERDAALKAEREQKEKEKREQAELLRKEKEEKEKALKEQRAREAEELRIKKEQERQLIIAQNEEKKKLEIEEAQKREEEQQLKKAEKEKQLLEQKAKEKEERLRKQEEQAKQMKAKRDEAFNKKYQNNVEDIEKVKPSINWGEGLVDSSVDDYKDKVNKVKKKKSLAGLFNFLSILIFIGLVGFGYFKFIKPSMDTNKEMGRLSYTINKDFKLSNKAEDNRFYSYGESCGLRLSYGSTNDANSFVDNYFNDIKTQYESDMNSFTEKSSLKINGNTWSELSVIYLEDVEDLSKKENIVKYRYVSIVYEGKFYHTVFVNPNNDKKCYDMYEEFIQSMEFDKKR